jgi:aspartate kinase
MAEAGAKVLNAEAVEFAKRHGIAIYARKTDDPAHAARETVVRLGVVREASGVRAVVSESKIAYVSGKNVALEAVTAVCGENEVPMKELHVGGEELRFVVPLARVPDWARGRAALEGVALDVREDLGAVSLVGDGITRDVRVLNRALSVLARERVVAESLVTTAFRISVLVERSTVERITRALHTEFVATDGASVALESEG